MNDHTKYILRLISAIVVALGGIGWIVMFVLDIFVNKSPMTPGTIIIPFLGICLLGIGILLIMYTLNEQKNQNDKYDDK